MTETEFIRRLHRIFGNPQPGVLGIGDDAALIPADSRRRWVWTTDCHVENVHFRWNWLNADEIGMRAAAAALSDVAAMGALPLYALLSFDVSRKISQSKIFQIARGIQKTMKLHSTAVVGGNVSSSATFSIHISILGRLHGKKPWLRSGAKPGDAVYVSGTPGLSALAVQTLRRRGSKNATAREAIEKWKRPTPRFDVVRRLGDRVNGAIDISDGLLADAKHIADEAGVRLEIDLDLLPRPQAYKTAWERIALSPSDDYELLITLQPQTRVSERELKSLGLSRIGKVMPRTGG